MRAAAAILLATFSWSLLAANPTGMDVDYQITDEVSLEVQILHGNLDVDVPDGKAFAQFRVITAEERVLDLFVAPTSFLISQDIRIRPGHHVTVTGVIVSQASGDELIVAREVAVGNRIYLVRDSHGRPIWEFFGS